MFFVKVWKASLLVCVFSLRLGEDSASLQTRSFLRPGSPLNNQGVAVSSDAPNLVIAGVGNSGTRGVKDLMQKLGLQMCYDVNDSQDNMKTDPGFHPKVRKALKSLLEGDGGRISLAAYQRDSPQFQSLVSWQEKAVAETARCAREGSHAGPWGFKNPQQLYLWPISKHLYGDRSKLLLVARDPRDICSSRNQIQFNTYCESLLGRRCGGESDCYSFWAKLNSDFLDENANTDSVRLVRIEDLAVPEPEVSRARVECLLDFSGLRQRQGEIGRLWSRGRRLLFGDDDIATAVSTIHAHSKSYMGRHYGASDADRKSRVEFTSKHQDPLVRKTMLRLGYDPDSFSLLQPRESTVC